MKRTHQVLREIDTALDQFSPDGMKAKVDSLIESAAPRLICDDFECDCRRLSDDDAIPRIDATGHQLIVYASLSRGSLFALRAQSRLQDLPLPDYGKGVSSALLNLHQCENFFKHDMVRETQEVLLSARMSFRDEYTPEIGEMLKDLLRTMGVPPYEIFLEGSPFWEGTGVINSKDLAASYPE